MSWHRGRLAAFDIETTGVDMENGRIVTAAVALVGDGRPAESHNWLIDPGVEIPVEATAVHGISTEKAQAEGRIAAEAIAEINAVLAAQQAEGIPIVAFNARFDLTFLDRESRRHGLETLGDLVGSSDRLLVVDPFVLDKQVDRYRRGARRLTTVCEHYGIPLDDAHTADADALAAARVAWKLGEQVADLNGLEVADLHQRQIVWAAEQAASLQEYFKTKGREEVVDGSWPLIPFSDDVTAAVS